MLPSASSRSKPGSEYEELFDLAHVEVFHSVVHFQWGRVKPTRDRLPHRQQESVRLTWSTSDQRQPPEELHTFEHALADAKCRGVWPFWFCASRNRAREEKELKGIDISPQSSDVKGSLSDH